jgi:hypothetical protein
LNANEFHGKLETRLVNIFSIICELAAIWYKFDQFHYLIYDYCSRLPVNSYGLVLLSELKCVITSTLHGLASDEHYRKYVSKFRVGCILSCRFHGIACYMSHQIVLSNESI